MNRKISKVAVLGSGIMGSRIACHFANIGVNVLLLDIASEGETNKIVNTALQNTLKSSPSPVWGHSGRAGDLYGRSVPGQPTDLTSLVGWTSAHPTACDFCDRTTLLSLSFSNCSLIPERITSCTLRG